MKTRQPDRRARAPDSHLTPWVGPHPAHRRIPVAKTPIAVLVYDSAPYRNRPGSAGADWHNLDGAIRSRIRKALLQDFGSVCAYCQRSCEVSDSTGTRPSAETVDHFRPRDHFIELQFDWLNLVYACQGCNQTKGNQWPGYGDDQTNQLLAAEDSRYAPASEYINPNAADGRRRAPQFFKFNVETGEIYPADQLDPAEWSIARRTISDIDLNDTQLGENDPNHLWNRRRNQRDLLKRTLDRLSDDGLKERVVSRLTSHQYPFSSFVSAYVSEEFPEC